MLSPGQFHKHVPRDPAENLAYRRRLLDACAESESDLAAVKAMCRDDLLFYASTFVWTFRPKAAGHEPKLVPFVAWECQDKAFRTLLTAIDRQRDLVGEKSRDMGWSWMCVIAADWCWRFQPWFKIGMFSRVADLVDSKDPDSLFWKLRHVQKFLPAWLWPEGWVKRLHDTTMHLENPETNSVITGQATTQDMGVAGRCTWCVFDEFSRVPNAKTVLDNTKDTSDCRVFVSTHTGPGTTFHGLCTNGVTDKIVTHWSEHPEKRRGLYRYRPEWVYPNDVEFLDPDYEYPPGYVFVRNGTPVGGPEPCLRSPWYDQQCRERTKTDVRTNLDIDVTGATSQVFDATLIRRLAGDSQRGIPGETAMEPLWVGDVLIEPDGTGRLAEREGGPLRLWVRPDLDGGLKRALYVMGGDVAAGTGATPSVLSIVEKLTREKVGEYSNPDISPERFAHAAAAIGRLFCDPSGREARFGWDASGSVGQAFTKTFVRLGYHNFRYHPGKLGLNGQVEDTDKPGVYLNSNDAKATVLLEYHSALEKRAFINRSERALVETLQFRWEGGQVIHATEANPADESAARLSHSDHVVADMIANMLLGPWKQPAAEPEPDPDPAPPPGGWEWRRQQGDREDRERQDGWQV